MRAVNDGAEIDGAATGGGTASVSVWRRRDFRIAWSAGFVNDTGDWVLNVALPVFVFVETGSGAQTAVLFVCQLLAAALFGPIGGAIVDRTDLRRALVATNVLQALFLAPLLAVSADRVWPAYLVVVAQALLSQVNNPANVALLPRVVADDELAVANAALSASASLARLGGAPLGGLLVAWQGLGPVVAVDAASFVIVAVALCVIVTFVALGFSSAPSCGKVGLSYMGVRGISSGSVHAASLARSRRSFLRAVVEPTSRAPVQAIVPLTRRTSEYGAVPPCVSALGRLAYAQMSMRAFGSQLVELPLQQ